MDHQLSPNVHKHRPGSLIALFCYGNRQLICKPVKVIDDGAANLSIRGGPRPKIRWCPPSHAGDTRKRRYAEFLVLLKEEARPPPQVLEEQVELCVQIVVLGDLPVGLLDVLDDIDNLTQHLIESSDGIGRQGQRGEPNHERTEVLVN
jgi:hypothetical protein